MGTGDLTEPPAAPVSVGTVFDRFPASVRGAVVVRAQDRQPHQIRLVTVRVTQAHDPAKEVHRAAAPEAAVDVAPHKEVLFPFDVPFVELGPGWFCVTAEVEVDGTSRFTGPVGGGKRFGVPWPPEEVRRVDLKPNLEVGPAVIDRIRSKPEGTEIRWRATTEYDIDLRVSAGSRRLPVVETTTDPRSGIRTTIAHPLQPKASQLTIELVGGGGKASSTIDLA